MLPRPCLQCGRTYSTGNPTRCPRCHAQKEAARRTLLDDPSYRRHRRHLKTRRNVCHLCGLGIDPALKHPHPGSLSVDHATSRHHGGTNAPSNLKPAHLGCNSRKGAGT